MKRYCELIKCWTTIRKTMYKLTFEILWSEAQQQAGLEKIILALISYQLNIELLCVVAQEKFILLNCQCSSTNTRVIAARPGVSSEPSKSSNEIFLLSNTHLHAPLLEWVYFLATLANFRNGRRQETYLSSCKELAVMVVLGQAWGPAFAQKCRRRGCSRSIWK